MTFSSTRVKLSQIPHVNFELASQLLFQFCIILHCHDTKLPANFNLIHFLLWIKGYHQSLNFKTSGHALVKENLLNSSCHFCNQKSVFLQMLHQDSVPSNITPLNFFLAQILYTLFKRSSIKCKFLRFLSDKVKTCQCPHVSFQLTSSSNFASFYIVMTNNSPVSFKLIHCLLWI